ncbi:MAG: hypothetical protein CVU48_09885 [Candidatus Cloacimonetes bacterium HGW-Cloacimonetes-1]|jgi:excinuclease UvrABC nuclease subunit|nr:MAG: hypothetical protein CVU48_09885 [Candidatus Cloacimonetes bacterium HGW-Cloacimonetes-1]
METIIVNSSLEQNLARVPAKWGVFAFRAGEQYLYYSKSGNLRTRLNGMYATRDSESSYSDLFLEATEIDYTVIAEPIHTLMEEKIFLQNNMPMYQHRLQTWRNFCYLGIDANTFPYITIQQHTNGDWTYVGPFRSTFFVTDVIDTYSRILKLPNCQGKDYPCDRLNENTCSGYCQNLMDGINPKQEFSLEKLQHLLKEAFLHPNNGVVELIKREKERYFDNLEFEKADLLIDEIDLLNKYRDWLNFFYTTKELSFSNDVMTVKNGLMTQCRYKGKTYLFSKADIEFRENEKLAIDKDGLDEARIIYDYYKK